MWCISLEECLPALGMKGSGRLDMALDFWRLKGKSSIEGYLYASLAVVVRHLRGRCMNFKTVSASSR